jgi:hypothetical protein
MSQTLHLAQNKHGQDCNTQQAIYRKACLNIRSALKNKQYLESIALSESVMAHCLALRKAWLQYQDVTRTRFSSIGALVFELTGVKLNGIWESDKSASSLYVQVMDWYEQKNWMLHALLAVDEKDSTWEFRRAALEPIAKQGANLVDQMVVSLDRLNAQTSHMPMLQPV